MAKVRRFEELICWQKGRELANKVYSLTDQPDFARDYGLRNQIQAAAGSVMHNVAEGCDAGTDAEFIRFLKMARRSCSEVQSQLYLAFDRKYITAAELQQTCMSADEVKRLINGLIAYLRKGNQKASVPNQIHELPATYLITDGKPSAHPAADYQTNDR